MLIYQNTNQSIEIFSNLFILGQFILSFFLYNEILKSKSFEIENTQTIILMKWKTKNKHIL